MKNMDDVCQHRRYLCEGQKIFVLSHNSPEEVTIISRDKDEYCCCFFGVKEEGCIDLFNEMIIPLWTKVFIKALVKSFNEHLYTTRKNSDKREKLRLFIIYGDKSNVNNTRFKNIEYYILDREGNYLVTSAGSLTTGHFSNKSSMPDSQLLSDAVYFGKLSKNSTQHITDVWLEATIGVAERKARDR